MDQQEDVLTEDEETDAAQGADSTHSADGDMAMPAPDMRHPHTPVSTHAASSTDEAEVAEEDEDEDDDEIDDDDDPEESTVETL